ncbi:transposable element Tc3 transposase [Trichonephila clavipes]|nr:transposable element Tc3 transposase [Trichonephila clavipes]
MDDKSFIHDNRICSTHGIRENALATSWFVAAVDEIKLHLLVFVVVNLMALITSKFSLSILLLRPPLAHFILFAAYQTGLGSRSPIGFGLLQGEWTHGPDLTLLISGMRNNNSTVSAYMTVFMELYINKKPVKTTLFLVRIVPEEQQAFDIGKVALIAQWSCALLVEWLRQKQNCRIWSEANPQVYLETPLHPEKLTVWCILWAGGIIGPYFFKNDEGHNVTVNGDRYRAMITNFFIPELNNHDVQELWFQQDGATCHTARATIDLLKDTFGDRLISRFGPVNWSPRSCDLTPLDYFLWGYVKSLVYADKPHNLDHLEDICRVIADIRPQMLEKVIEN